MAKVLIRDGMTRDGRWPGEVGLPEVKFRYRPARPQKFMEYQREVRECDRKDIGAAVAKLIAAHVVEWDIDHPEKEGKAPIDAEHVAMIPDVIQFFMVDAIGSRPAALQYEQEKN